VLLAWRQRSQQAATHKSAEEKEMQDCLSYP
jgi:hypothetical protein